MGLLGCERGSPPPSAAPGHTSAEDPEQESKDTHIVPAPWLGPELSGANSAEDPEQESKDTHIVPAPWLGPELSGADSERNSRMAAPSFSAMTHPTVRPPGSAPS